MKELLKVEANSKTLDSREVAEMVGKEHAHLMRDIQKYAEYLDESKIGLVEFFQKSTYQDSKGEIRPCYQITKKGCEMIANKITGKKGIIFTASYVNKFNEMEEQFKIPKSYAEALRAHANEVEAHEETKKELAEVKPYARLGQAISTSYTSILVGDMAKILQQNGVKTGQNIFFKWLRENGYLCCRPGEQYNMPTSYSMRLGLMEIKETVIIHGDREIVNKTPKISGLGQQYFIDKFLTDKKRVNLRRVK